ncbi:MAG TPA: site-2 protease family protein [Stellaceae bacterium]|jgi:Zn-dependent protease|nr:site-2 protease family protein [Stellaceae bacterium]
MIVDGQLATMVKTVTTWIVPLIFAVTFHEAAHGYVALRFGDDTALRAGRVSLNPINHIDPLGTILLPLLMLMARAGFFFGYAKPVPVNFGRLKPLRLGMVLVALAGPATNVVLAIVSALLFLGVGLVPQAGQEWLALNLVNSLKFNAILCVFNMLPLPPLDGGRVAVGLLPRPLAMPLARVEPYGMLILMGLFVLSYASAQVGLGLNILGWLIGVPANWLIRFVLLVTGQGG